MKSVLLFLLVAVLLGFVAYGCSDGRLNLLLLSYGDQEDPPEPVWSGPGEPPPRSSSSSAPPVISSSSVEVIAVVSSSSVEPPSSSSLAPPPSSSSIPAYSSSNRGVRSSASNKVNKDGVEYPDLPTLEEGAPGVMKSELGGVTRYWDGCKPSCSWVNDVVQDGIISPHGFARQCDRNGKEMPLFYRQPGNPQDMKYYAEFLGTPSACNPHTLDEWLRSQTYADWRAENPSFPSGAQSVGYVCTADQIPYAVNDTLAYAFAASTGHCGKCFMLQFRGDLWAYDDNPRVAHRALKGKTLIIMVNNFGVGAFGGESTSFDLMVPGGGVGMYDAISEQLGLPSQPQQGDPSQAQQGDYGALGARYGGLLTECTFGGRGQNFSNMGVGLNPIERASLEEIQECLRAKCNRAFKNNKDLLKGCLWHADWFMAADNPEAYYKEVDCPKYLLDRYGSSFPLPTRPDDLIPTAHCNIGKLTCPAP